MINDEDDKRLFFLLLFYNRRKKKWSGHLCAPGLDKYFYFILFYFILFFCPVVLLYSSRYVDGWRGPGTHTHTHTTLERVVDSIHQGIVIESLSSVYFSFFFFFSLGEPMAYRQNGGGIDQRLGGRTHTPSSIHFARRFRGPSLVAGRRRRRRHDQIRPSVRPSVRRLAILQIRVLTSLNWVSPVLNGRALKELRTTDEVVRAFQRRISQKELS